MGLCRTDRLSLFPFPISPFLAFLTNELRHRDNRIVPNDSRLSFSSSAHLIVTWISRWWSWCCVFFNGRTESRLFCEGESSCGKVAGESGGFFVPRDATLRISDSADGAALFASARLLQCGILRFSIPLVRCIIFLEDIVSTVRRPDITLEHQQRSKKVESQTRSVCCACVCVCVCYVWWCMCDLRIYTLHTYKKTNKRGKLVKKQRRGPHIQRRRCASALFCQAADHEETGVSRRGNATRWTLDMVNTCADFYTITSFTEYLAPWRRRRGSAWSTI